MSGHFSVRVRKWSTLCKLDSGLNKYAWKWKIFLVIYHSQEGEIKSRLFMPSTRKWLLLWKRLRFVKKIEYLRWVSIYFDTLLEGFEKSKIDYPRKNSESVYEGKRLLWIFAHNFQKIQKLIFRWNSCVVLRAYKETKYLPSSRGQILPM